MIHFAVVLSTLLFLISSPGLAQPQSWVYSCAPADQPQVPPGWASHEIIFRIADGESARFILRVYDLHTDTLVYDSYRDDGDLILSAQTNGARGAGSSRLAQAEAAKGAESAGVREVLAVYPNPTTASATVALTLEKASDVRVVVYNVLGRRVALLAEGPLEIGTHRFALDGSGLPAGVYLVRVESGERRLSQRITLLR